MKQNDLTMPLFLPCGDITGWVNNCSGEETLGRPEKPKARTRAYLDASVHL